MTRTAERPRKGAVGRREDIDNAIWGDPEFEALPPDAKLLYLWSFTNSQCNMAGVYKVSVARMAGETGLSASRASRALEQLAAASFVVYEQPWLWVRSRVKHIRSSSPSMARSIVRDVEALDPAHPIRQQFIATYQSLVFLREALSGAAKETRSTKPKTDTLPRGCGDPLEGSQGPGPGLRQGSTAPQQGEVDGPPTDLSPPLAAAVAPVKTVLDRVFAAKGGTVAPTLAAVGRALDSYPDRDHVEEARKLEHWAVHGSGQRRASKDIVLRYRKWLESADAWTAPTGNGSRHEAELARTRRVLAEAGA